MIGMTMEWMAELNFVALLEQCLKFYGELILGFAIFAYPLRRRKHCFIKLPIGILVGCALIIPIVFLGYSLWNNFGFENQGVTALIGFLVFFFLVLSFVSVLFTGKMGFSASWWELFFCGICGYSTQHICYRFSLLLQYYFFFDSGSPWSVVLFWATVIIIYALMFLLFGRRLKGMSKIEIENKRIIVLFGVVLLAMIICSGLSMTYIGHSSMQGTVMVLVESLMAIIICYLAIVMLFDSARTKHMQEENRRIQLLWKSDRKQYEVSKQNVEQLNMKYHDLKYQLRALKSDDYASGEIEQCLRIYDSLYRTGNETLDVALTEKSMLAAKHGITIACMADGECLGGMESGYIYSLFGNAIDNAVECLCDTAIDSKVIDISVRKRKEMVSINIENFVSVPPIMKNGLPITTKADQNNHGYGLKSIRSIVQAYGGNLRIDVRDEIFTLDILLPFPLRKN